MKNHVKLLKQAIQIVGSQKKLAEKTGVSQQGISYLLNLAPKVSAEFAIAAEMATDGLVTRSQFRPDIFPVG